MYRISLDIILTDAARTSTGAREYRYISAFNVVIVPIVTYSAILFLDCLHNMLSHVVTDSIQTICHFYFHKHWSFFIVKY